MKDQIIPSDFSEDLKSYESIFNLCTTDKEEEKDQKEVLLEHKEISSEGSDFDEMKTNKRRHSDPKIQVNMKDQPDSTNILNNSIEKRRLSDFETASTLSQPSMTRFMSQSSEGSHHDEESKQKKKEIQAKGKGCIGNQDLTTAMLTANQEKA